MLIDKASCDEPFTLNGSWAWSVQNMPDVGVEKDGIRQIKAIEE
jgi:hypothetical protein